MPGIKRVDANDLDSAVCDSMRRNVAFNGGAAQERIRVLTNDARIIMMQSPDVRLCDCNCGCLRVCVLVCTWVFMHAYLHAPWVFACVREI